MRLHTGTVTRPRYESAPYRMHPGRREYIFGKIRPMDNSSGGFLGNAVMLVVAVLIGMMLAIGGAF